MLGGGRRFYSQRDLLQKGPGMALGYPYMIYQSITGALTKDGDGIRRLATGLAVATSSFTRGGLENKKTT